MTTERIRQEGFTGGPGRRSDEFAAGNPNRDGRVEVIYGVHAHSLPLAGMSVRQARGELTERMNIAPDALAVVDGVESDEDTILRVGQVLNFVKHAGEKGGRSHGR